MRIFIPGLKGNTITERLREVVTEHAGEEIVWNANNYAQQTISELPELFTCINEYWARLPMQRQGRIFALYKEIYDVTLSVSDMRRLTDKLRPLVASLLAEHSPEEIYWYLKLPGNMVMPATLRDNLAENHRSERTYLRDEYMGLAMIAMLLRTMVPVWGEFCNQQNAAGDRREVQAVKLLDGSGLLERPEMVKLRTLVEVLVKEEQVPLAALLSVVGSEDMGGWLFAQTLVRRVAIGEISRMDQTVNIVSNVHKHVTSSMAQLERRYGGRVAHKYGSGDSSEREDNSSNIEAHKEMSVVAPGELELDAVFTNDITSMALKVDPSIDLEKLRHCIEAIERARYNSALALERHQDVLAQWCMAYTVTGEPVLSVESIRYLRENHYKVLCVTQALLWHWGFPNLAMLVCVGARERTDNDFVNSEQRTRIPKDIAAKLQQLFPYYKGVPQTGVVGTENSKENAGHQAIENFCKYLNNKLWVDLNPPALRAQAKINIVDGTIVIHGSIKVELAQLGILIAER